MTSYEQRVMQYQQSTMRDVLRNVSVLRLAYELYTRCEPVIVVAGVFVIFTAGLIKAIG